ncbi:hypothetical protein ACRE_012580 [Hapsidospora chrysogenum ATCC 11550]|uniref:Uncharacterized protein n=1 Tax=Hapsidospora chrysogenum (strain ATCC 11550 / CBS 779.69 / DSM 880 / IAM 14645 / JCM 23072 / IMI 49137) TaxID=857340 RepID=A0A086TEZ6_HAPC1|nr:hypothetical protein ACRE_012580 [Hapsidospora chrysogenum ATCC 11550]
MAIRDRFRRALHKSKSDTNMSQTMSDATTAPAATSSETSSQPSSLRSQPTPPKFTFTWGRGDKGKEHHRKEEKEKKKAQKKTASSKPIHPRDRPLTASNLRHQEMLGGFDFSFGSSPSRMSQLVSAGPLEEDGISPCCTRPTSINGDALTSADEDSDPDPTTMPAVERRCNTRQS